MEYLVGLLCLLGLFVLLDVMIGEDDQSIPSDLVRRRKDREL